MERSRTRKMNLPRLRLLPLTIFAASMMLTFRLSDIWQGVDGLMHGSVKVAGASAQEERGKPPAGGKQAEAPKAPPAAPGAPPAETGAPPQSAASEAEQEIRRRRPSLADDPTLFTQSEIDLLQQLAERREQLDAREREIAERDAMLRAAEGKIDAKIRQMQGLQATIEGLIKKYDQQQDEKLVSLVKIYENMKPKDAAKIFEELDMDTLLLVAERMKERKLAEVMSKMNPLKAKEMTEELFRLRQLPDAGPRLGG